MWKKIGEPLAILLRPNFDDKSGIFAQTVKNFVLRTCQSIYGKEKQPVIIDLPQSTKEKPKIFAPQSRKSMTHTVGITANQIVLLGVMLYLVSNNRLPCFIHIVPNSRDISCSASKSDSMVLFSMCKRTTPRIARKSTMAYSPGFCSCNKSSLTVQRVVYRLSGAIAV